MCKLRFLILYRFNNHLRLATLILFLNQQLRQFGKSGFAAEKTKIIKEMGLWFFARMSPVRTVPVCQLGIKTNFLYPENGKLVTAIKLCSFKCYLCNSCTSSSSYFILQVAGSDIRGCRSALIFGKPTMNPGVCWLRWSRLQQKCWLSQQQKQSVNAYSGALARFLQNKE